MCAHKAVMCKELNLLHMVLNSGGNEQHALKISPLETPARKVVKVSDTDENDDGLKFLRPTFRARKLQECFHPPKAKTKTMTLKECVLSPSTERCNVSPTFSPTLRIL